MRSHIYMYIYIYIHRSVHIIGTLPIKSEEREWATAENPLYTFGQQCAFVKLSWGVIQRRVGVGRVHKEQTDAKANVAQVLLQPC